MRGVRLREESYNYPWECRGLLGKPCQVRVAGRRKVQENYTEYLTQGTCLVVSMYLQEVMKIPVTSLLLLTLPGEREKQGNTIEKQARIPELVYCHLDAEKVTILRPCCHSLAALTTTLSKAAEEMSRVCMSILHVHGVENSSVHHLPYKTTPGSAHNL